MLLFKYIIYITAYFKIEKVLTCKLITKLELIMNIMRSRTFNYMTKQRNSIIFTFNNIFLLLIIILNKFLIHKIETSNI